MRDGGRGIKHQYLLIAARSSINSITTLVLLNWEGKGVIVNSSWISPQEEIWLKIPNGKRAPPRKRKAKRLIENESFYSLFHNSDFSPPTQLQCSSFPCPRVPLGSYFSVIINLVRSSEEISWQLQSQGSMPEKNIQISTCINSHCHIFSRIFYIPVYIFSYRRVSINNVLFHSMNCST